MSLVIVILYPTLEIISVLRLDKIISHSGDNEELREVGKSVDLTVYLIVLQPKHMALYNLP